MRKTAVPWSLGMLVAGLVFVAGLAGVSRARAADEPSAWLGVYTQELTSELRDAMGYDGPDGVVVTRVVGDSPAARAGLRKSDVILSVSSRPVESPSELQDVIAGSKVGQTITVAVYRDGANYTLTAKLGARPDDASSVAPEPPLPPGPPRAPLPPKPPKPPVVREWTGEGDVLKGLGELGSADKLMQIFGGPARGRLGVRIESLSPVLGEYFGLADGKGVLVLEVLEDTPAERAGLKPGDVITRVGDKPVADSQDLVDALRGREGKVALRVVRHNAGRTVEATLEKPGTPGSGQGWTEIGPGTRRVIRLRSEDDASLRREVEQLKRQLEKLQQRLDEQEKSDRNE